MTKNPSLKLLAALLALVSSLMWGTSDFLGGVTSRRLPALAVYGLSQASVRGDFVGAELLVKKSLDNLIAASERGVEITGLASGYADLDRMTGGYVGIAAAGIRR